MRPILLSPQFNRWGYTHREFKWFARGLTAGKPESQPLKAGFELQSGSTAYSLNLCTTLHLARGISPVSGSSQPYPTPDKAWNGIPEFFNTRLLKKGCGDVSSVTMTADFIVITTSNNSNKRQAHSVLHYRVNLKVTTMEQLTCVFIPDPP